MSTNLASNIVPPLAIPTSAIAPIQSLAKAIDRTSPRAYATVVGIRDGFACVTDGFALLQLRLPLLDGLNGVVKPDMTEAQVKFPDWRAVLSQMREPRLRVDGAATMALLRAFSGAAVAKAEIRLVFIECGDGTAFPTMQVDPCVDSFNPFVASRFVKVIPKDAEPIAAGVHEDVLQIEFNTGHTLVLCAVRGSKDGGSK